MDIIEIGTTLLRNKFGSDINSEAIAGALGKLLGGKGGSIDIPELVSKFLAVGGLQGIVNSWLGDGSNDGISVDQIQSFFGGEKIKDFASHLNIGEKLAAEGLAEAVPQMIDKASSGGSLLDEVADLGGIMDFAKKLF